MRKQKRIFIVLAAIFALLFAACENELPQGMPRPMITQPTETPPSPTPSPTPDPYRGVRYSWIGGAAVKWRGGKMLELLDTPATGERETLNAIEEQILAGECVLLENGTELDLDGNGTREKICYGNGTEEVEIQIGASQWRTEHSMLFEGKLYGICLDAANPSQIQLLIEEKDKYYSEEHPQSVSYLIISYCQKDGFCWTGYSAVYRWEDGFGEAWPRLSPDGTFSMNGKKYLYRCWELEGNWNSQIFELFDGIKPVNQLADTTVDVFAYKEGTKELCGYIPAGSRLLVLAQNDEWLYVTDCNYSVHAWIQLQQTADGVMVDAPYKVSLEDALRHEADGNPD